MMFSFDQVVGLLSNNAYLVLLPLSIVEGPVVTLASGFLISIGRLNPLVAFGIVVAGDLVGDAILYSLGRWGSERVMSAWRKDGRAATRVRQLKDQILSEADRMLIVGKLTHAIGAPVLLAAGIIRMPVARFMTISFGATLLKSFALLVAGYWIGASYPTIVGNPLYFSGALLLLGGVALYMLVFRRRTKKPIVHVAPPASAPHQLNSGLAYGPDLVTPTVTKTDPNCVRSPSKSRSHDHSRLSRPSARAA